MSLEMSERKLAEQALRELQRQTEAMPLLAKSILEMPEARGWALVAECLQKLGHQS